MGRFTNYAKSIARLYTAHPEKSGLSWPPGSLNFFNRFNKREQTFLLSQSKKYGPVFKQWMYGQHTTCVVGHARGRKLLRDHQASLSSVTIDQTPLYPKGGLRTMQGDEHKAYRKALIEAVNAAPLGANRDFCLSILQTRLSELNGLDTPRPVSADQLRQVLHECMTDIMILFAFGVEPDSNRSTRLKRAYRELGEKAPVNRIGSHQKEAFASIIGILAEIEGEIADNPASSSDSFLKHLVRDDKIDQTLRGNLVYMVETGRFDVSSLWRWVLYYLAGHEDVMRELENRIEAHDLQKVDEYLNAIVLETLRLDQSEYVLRFVADDISFDGYSIPKNTRLRVCTWEGHRDPSIFPEPFEFRPERFVGRKYSVEEYSPFGMDKHRCLGVDLTMDVTKLFISVMFGQFQFKGVGIGKPIRGKHHWEPNTSFSIELAAKPAVAKQRPASAPR